MKKALLFALLASFVSFGAPAANPGKTAATPAAKTLKLDTKASTLKWVGSKIAGPHNGTVGIKSGEVTVDNNVVTGGSFVVDMTTIKNNDLTDATWNKKLVDHLSSEDFFNVKAHSEAIFKITKVEAGKGEDRTISGDLTIKGITKPIKFPAKITEDKGVYSAKAKFKINRLDWGVKYNSGKFFDPKTLGDKMIHDEIEIEIDLKTLGA